MKLPFRYILVGSFLAAIILIVFLQFNSNQSINELIGSNEDLMQSYTVKTQLQKIQKHLLTLDLETKNIIIKNRRTLREQQHLQRAFQNLAKSQQALNVHLGSDARVLNQWIDKKTRFVKSVLDTFLLKGKSAAEAVINSGMGKAFSDSIKWEASEIETRHQKTVTELVNRANNDGLSAKAYGTTLALIAALTAILAFGYISYKMMEQQQLIQQLNLSEFKARETAHLKETFLANMSHEIRTPLNAILGFTELLQKKDLAKDTQKHVDTIHRAGNTLLHIVNNILDLSKIEAGMMLIETHPFSMSRTLENIEEIFKPKAIEKNISLNFQLDPTLPDWLEGDVVKLKQILVNLIGNAIKFTPSGSIWVEVSLALEQEDSLMSLLNITDTGIGINATERQAIFERFHQADEATTRRYGGTGLGLSIVRDLVNLLDGTIQLESEPGRGSRFSLHIPFKKQKGALPDSILLSQPSQTDPIPPQKRILVVEDHEMNRSLMYHLLGTWGMQVDMAHNGIAALGKWQNHDYDLILMDIQMPEMDGYSTTQIIRHQFQSQIPIIAMTAHALPGEREKCLALGMDDYISKPIVTEQLRGLLITHLSKDRRPSLFSAMEPAMLAAYQYLDVSYLQSISLGNSNYEKTATLQFIENFPKELAALEACESQAQVSALRRLAHQLKTTISIMGSPTQIQQDLDYLENEPYTQEIFQRTLFRITQAGAQLLGEAKQYYDQLQGH